MKVQLNGEQSDEQDLIGGGPQGTLLGVIEYLVQSNDNADDVDKGDRFNEYKNMRSMAHWGSFIEPEHQRIVQKSICQD